MNTMYTQKNNSYNINKNMWYYCDLDTLYKYQMTQKYL